MSFLVEHQDFQGLCGLRKWCRAIIISSITELLAVSKKTCNLNWLCNKQKSRGRADFRLSVQEHHQGTFHLSILLGHAGFITRLITLMSMRYLPPAMECNPLFTFNRNSHSFVSCWPQVVQACPSMKQLLAMSLDANDYLRWTLESAMLLEGQQQWPLNAPFYTWGKWRAMKLVFCLWSHSYMR